MAKLLDVTNLRTSFFTPEGEVKAVSGVSYHVDQEEIIAVVGESGCGKSVTQMSVMQLIQTPPGKILSGEVNFEGHNLLKYSAHSKEMMEIRGSGISMIFQEPMTSLNPVLRIGKQIAEPLEIHEGLHGRAAEEKTVNLLELVGIPDARRRLNDYPHQFSGGMRQRVMIAMALACTPRLLLADEPTTALDITIQGQILRLLGRLARERNMGVLLITHDLGVVAEAADDVAVMYAGELMEQAPVASFFERPLHPYSQGLMACAPLLGNHDSERLPSIPGMVPLPSELPEGCSFRPRCPFASEQCLQAPPLVPVGESRLVRCWKASA